MQLSGELRDQITIVMLEARNPAVKAAAQKLARLVARGDGLAKALAGADDGEGKPR